MTIRMLLLTLFLLPHISLSAEKHQMSELSRAIQTYNTARVRELVTNRKINTDVFVDQTQRYISHHQDLKRMMSTNAVLCGTLAIYYSLDAISTFLNPEKTEAEPAYLGKTWHYSLGAWGLLGWIVKKSDNNDARLKQLITIKTILEQNSVTVQR